MPGRSMEDRLAETETRIRQLEARKQLLAQQIKQQERKTRTRRLIQIGGIMARLGVDTLEKAQALQCEVEKQSRVQEWLKVVVSRATVPGDGNQHQAIEVGRKA